MQSMSVNHTEETTLAHKIKNNKKKILIVDDNSDQLVMYKFLLQSSNSDFEYITFSSVEKAINYIKRMYNPKYQQIFDESTKISLIISDYNMFPKNGFDFFKELKKMNFSYPFVLFSSFMSNNIVKEARELGIKECIEKDMDMTKTICKLSDHLNP